MANDNGSLSHTKWNWKYHIVFAPKYRRQVVYRQIKADIGRYRKDNQAAMRDEESGNHRGRSMPGSYPYVSEHTAKYQCIAVCGISKGKKYIDDIRQTCQSQVQIWKQGYYVDTVGRNKKVIEEYIKNQLQEDIAADQITLKEYIDPFTGNKNTKA